MIRVLACFAFVALVCAEEAQPSTLEATFTAMSGSIQQLAFEEQYQRRLADIMLGLQVSQGFHAFGSAEYQKFHQDPTAGSLEEEEIAEKPVHRRHSLEEDEDAQQLEEMGADEFIQLKEEFVGFGAPAVPATASPLSLEQQSTNGKIQALKSLQLQLYLTGSDVEKSHWMSKMIAAVYPPQMASFKLYKTYLNTMALALAYQFHDAYTFESLIDDFNDRFISQTGGRTAMTEAQAEANVYNNWVSLATIKWQLFMISIYEQSMFPAPAAAANANNAAASLLEVEEQEQAEFVGAPSNALITQYAYMTYYVMMLKYYSLYTELQLSYAGLNAAHLKIQIHTSDSDDDSKNLAQLKAVEGEQLPYLYTQWASTNQMKYMLQYYTLMFDMQSPAFATSQAAQRMENSFVNLFQNKAETTTTPSN